MSLGNGTASLTDSLRGQQTTNSGQTAYPAIEEQQSPEPNSTVGRGNAPFACNVCKRNYTRVDHLARHYRSHTREKPFPCDVCGKHFSRADLLKRHAAGHIHGANNTRKRKASPTNRVSVACSACSAAKLKCKEEKPCRRCLQKDIECLTTGSDNGHQKVRHTIPESAEKSPHSVESEPIATDEVGSIGNAFAEMPQQDNRRMSLMEGESTLNFDAPETDIAVNTSQHLGAMLNVDTFLEQHPGTHSMLDGTWFPDDTSLGDFLADVMMPISQFSPADAATSNASVGVPDTTVRDVLNFGIETSLDLNDIDFGLLNSYNTSFHPQVNQPMLEDCSYPPSRAEDHHGPEVNNLSIEAFQRSLWRWTPGKLDQGQCEQMNLSLPSDIGVIVTHTDRPCEERLGQAARDKIMAMLFNTCEQSALSRILFQFPSAEILDCLMQDSLQQQISRSDSYIHVPTFRTNCMRPELVAIMVASGAVRNAVPVIRKLGFALQEAVRLAIPETFESDNRLTRDLQVLQAYIAELEISLWSGNKRKMEIAESHGLPLITMLRRSGRFRKQRPPVAAPSNDDSPAALDSKWRAWAEIESFKRLAYETTIYDSRVSIAFLIPPLVTYAETSLELPASTTLWKAKSASAWRDAYLSQVTNHKLPSLASCMQDPSSMADVYDRIDLRFSVDIILGLLWRLIWDARQLGGVAKQQSSRSVTSLSLVSGHWQQDLSQTLRNFRMTMSDIEPLSPAATILHEHLLLNIHVSFEELSLFAGKEGGQDARRVLPLLRKWADGRDSRQAVWHAGQVLREATLLPPDALRDFFAIALYHAGLTLWAYGILSNEMNRPSEKRSRSFSASGLGASSVQTQDTVFLDGVETPDTQKFIALNRAIPVIRRRSSPSKKEPNDTGEALPLADPKAVMETVMNVLQQNHCTMNGKIAPPLVENLTHLMQDLSKAASQVNRKR